MFSFQGNIYTSILFKIATNDKPFPQKAIDILTEVLIYAKQKGEKIVPSEYVNKIISESHDH